MSRRQSEGGFTLAELVMVIAVVGILSIMAVPSFLRYYQAAKLKSGAQQMLTLINQARELAIKENDKVCANLSSSTQMTYTHSNCTALVASWPAPGAAWVGAGTDAADNINLPTGITVTVSPNPAIFDYLGSAVTSPPATYTLTNTQTGATLTVSVAASGRVTIP